jgi:hypothetical protein
MVIRWAFSIAGLSATSRRGPLSEEDASATPERVGLDGRAGDVIGAVQRIGGAVSGLWRRAGGVLRQVEDDAVIRVPGVSGLLVSEAPALP